MGRLHVVSFLAPSVRPAYEAIAGFLGRALGLPVVFRQGRSYEELVSPETDVAFVCSYPYILETRKPRPALQPLAAPVLTGGRYEGKPIYFSDVIVSRESDAGSFRDLKGGSWAYNEPLSHSGFNVVRHRLAEMGEVGGFFSEVVEAGYHQKSIRLVAEGEVDASAIDTQVLEIELRDHPELIQRVKVIDTLGPSTIQPVVVAARLDDSVKEDLRAALRRVHTEEQTLPALRNALFERFVEIDDSDYDDIREMTKAAEAAGLETLG